MCLIVSMVVVNSCKSNDPEAQPAVVGTWKLNRIRFSGYPAPFTSLNADEASNQYGFDGNFTVKSDKTFNETFNNNGRISDLDGTWEFTNNELQLKYEDGSDDTYQLDTSREPIKLISTAAAATDSLRNPQTNAVQAVPFKFQFIYEKQQ
jgi:hypothetical protein